MMLLRLLLLLLMMAKQLRGGRVFELLGELKNAPHWLERRQYLSPCNMTIMYQRK